ncbi:cytochrome P450 [Suillus hirtellus]|nr:cytochrome P450 [Suillus hirtellus]
MHKRQILILILLPVFQSGCFLFILAKLLALLFFIYFSFSLFFIWIVKQQYQATRQLPLPPGPPGHWLLGNMMLKSQWTEHYGPVFSLKQGHGIFVVIGSHQAATDIMEKEGANLADRPHSIAVQEMLSDGLGVLLQGSGERLCWLCRVLHAGLQPKVVESYEPIQTRHNLVLDVLNDPKNHQGHAMRSIWPEAYLVDMYPILCFVPGYLSQLKAWQKENLTLYDRQLDMVQRQMHEGNTRPFFVRFMLEHQKEYQLKDKDLAYIAGGMFAAGSDTAASAITIMMMAAATHTDAQACVQEELDNIVGLLTFADQEMLLQRPVSLGGFAHHATKDIIWKNYLIPAGVTVIGNHWAIANDPEVFPEPHRFNPQCWINDAGHVCNDLWFFTFGIGQCPCQHVANWLVFVNMALILWAFHLLENPAVRIDTLAFSDTANICAALFEICFVKRINKNMIRKLCALGK